MSLDEPLLEVEMLNILSVNRLAELLKIPRKKLVSCSRTPRRGYCPYMAVKPPRPFQRKPLSKPRPIDNPSGDLRWVQDRIHRQLLKSICFPSHILGAVRKRSVRDNAERHLKASALVTVDIRQCFPSITNVQVYRVWRHLLGCSTPVAILLTKLTTVDRRLPQGAATSPLLANLFIWMIDEPLRKICEQLGVVYSTWIDDLAFSGDRARELIQCAASTLGDHGLRLSRQKIKIMGPNAIKLLTGTKLGASDVRAPKEKLSRIRSGIHKLRTKLVEKSEEERYIDGLVAQLRFIQQICPRDVTMYRGELREAAEGRSLTASARKFLALP